MTDYDREGATGRVCGFWVGVGLGLGLGVLAGVGLATAILGAVL